MPAGPAGSGLSGCRSLEGVALMSHTLLGGMAARGPCGESVVVGLRTGVEVVLDSVGSALSSCPEAPLA